MGIPPKIKKVFTDKKGTDFTLNALPLGGFVRVDGEDITKPNAFDEGNFMSKNWLQRVWVLIAGVIMNFFLAWIIFSALFFVGTRPISPIPFDIWRTNSHFLPSYEESIESWFITSGGAWLRPLPGWLAEKSGILPNDILLAVNSQPIQDTKWAIEIISSSDVVQLEILRKEEKIFLEIVPQNGKIETQIFDVFKIDNDFIKKYSLGESLIEWAKETYFSSILTIKLVGRTLGNFFFPETKEAHEEAKKSLSGPVGAGNAVITMLEKSVPVTMIFLFVALLSVNLAVMNILPFPALDGGRILFTTLYSLLVSIGISKTKILKIESIIHSFWFILLLLFMFYVVGLDISRLF